MARHKLSFKELAVNDGIHEKTEKHCFSEIGK
jgi:hypothetical protein